jgi:MoaD family protein
MRVAVRAFALLKDKIGTGEVTVYLPEGATVKQLIEMLGEKYGEDLTNILLTRDHELSDEVMVSLNGTRVDADDPLQDGSLVFFIPPLSGG